jgi:hypothetical protein
LAKKQIANQPKPIINNMANNRLIPIAADYTVHL